MSTYVLVILLMTATPPQMTWGPMFPGFYGDQDCERFAELYNKTLTHSDQKAFCFSEPQARANGWKGLVK